jgi:chitodextrinase
VISSTQINLSWTASTDNVGVTGYKIYQNNIQIGTTANTSYQNTGLKANTSYTYRVAAYDTAGNTSAKSVGLTKRTQPSPSTKFTMGDRVQTTWKVTVRSTPSNSGTASGTQLKGAIGRVAGGPVYSNLQWWWQIDFDSGVDGWVPQGKLKKVIP